MEHEVRNSFFQMLLNCYGLLLLGRDRREVILKHGEKSTLPLISCTVFG